MDDTSSPRRLPARLGWLLDGTELPGIGSDRVREGPIFLELHGFGTAPLNELITALFDCIVQQSGQEAHGDEILATLLPGFCHRCGAYGNVLEAVDAPLHAQPLALFGHLLVHLRCHEMAYWLHVTRHPRRLDVEKDLGGGISETHRIKGTIHLPDVPDTALQVALCR